ncbi:MAG: Nif3-like dinuclear metal center hexameric protein [Rhodothermales bacterium]
MSEDSIHPSVRDIAHFLEEWAPLSSAQSYDNVGLQVGDPTARVLRGLIALDMTPDVLEEAREMRASLIITHHPLIFRPLQSVTTEHFSGNLAFGLAASGIALYSIHTNLDAAPGGVSFALGRHLGLVDLDFLEMDSEDTGLGAIGRLERPEPLEDFLQRVAERLDAHSLRYAGDLHTAVERIAVCGGAGSEFIPQALAAGADAYVTADVTYHRFFDVLDTRGRPRMALVDAGHYETEVLTERLLQEELSQRFAEVEWLRSRTRTSPVRSFVLVSH